MYMRKCEWLLYDSIDDNTFQRLITKIYKLIQLSTQSNCRIFFDGQNPSFIEKGYYIIHLLVSATSIDDFKTWKQLTTEIITIRKCIDFEFDVTSNPEYTAIISTELNTHVAGLFQIAEHNYCVKHGIPIWIQATVLNIEQLTIDNLHKLSKQFETNSISAFYTIFGHYRKKNLTFYLILHVKNVAKFEAIQTKCEAIIKINMWNWVYERSSGVPIQSSELEPFNGKCFDSLIESLQNHIK